MSRKVVSKYSEDYFISSIWGLIGQQNSEVRQLNFGQSFQCRPELSKIHTVRYDFIPASTEDLGDGVLQVNYKKGYQD